MEVTLDLVLYILAFVCFVAAAIGVNAGRVSLVPLGLAFWVLATIV